MQHDHVLKKLDFDLIPSVGGGWGVGRVAGGLHTKYLVPCCCICNSLLFDMQHDHAFKYFIV